MCQSSADEPLLSKDRLKPKKVDMPKIDAGLSMSDQEAELGCTLDKACTAVNQLIAYDNDHAGAVASLLMRWSARRESLISVQNNIQRLAGLRSYYHQDCNNYLQLLKGTLRNLNKHIAQGA